jgi:hypothetical protein
MVVLIHIANVLYVVSYLVKETLWLRLLTVVAGSVLIAYYALLPVPLWAAIGWNVVFLAINLRQIQVLLLERRPVRLSPDELRLYQLAFRSLTQHEFAKLLHIARREDVAADQRFVTHGQGLNRIMVIAEGRARVEMDVEADSIVRRHGPASRNLHCGQPRTLHRSTSPERSARPGSGTWRSVNAMSRTR